MLESVNNLISQFFYSYSELLGHLGPGHDSGRALGHLRRYQRPHPPLVAPERGQRSKLHVAQLVVGRHVVMGIRTAALSEKIIFNFFST